jgi:hypothetical protein
LHLYPKTLVMAKMEKGKNREDLDSF